jgi:hypothetical protein
MKQHLLITLCIAGLSLATVNTALANKDRIHIAGTVTNAASGKPLQGVSLSTYYSSDITQSDAQGHFTLLNAPPNAEATVNATAYGFLDIAQPITVASGKHTALNLKMTPLPAKYPKLTGDWTLTLQLDDAKHKPGITGMILFNPGIPDSRLPEWRSTPDTAAVMTEFAEYHLDAAPFFGKDDWVNTHTEAEGYITRDNKVVINLPMNVRDAEIRLDGTLKNGVIQGTWMKMGYAPTHSGTFTLRKGGVMPLTVNEAVQDIVSKLPAADKKLIRNTEAGKMIRFHRTLGAGIRNDYGLYRGNDALLGDACKNMPRKLDDQGKPFLYCHPDDASAVIWEAVWHKLQTKGKY